MYFNICDQLLNNSLFNELENDLFDLSYDNGYHGCNTPSWYLYTYSPKKQLTSTNRSTFPSRRNTTSKSVSSSSSSNRNSTIKAVPSSSNTMEKSSSSPLSSSSKKVSSPKTETTSPDINSPNPTFSSKKTFSPKLYFYEDDTNYYVHLYLPGITKDQIKLEIDNNDRYIAISGERKSINDTNDMALEQNENTTVDSPSNGKKVSLEECPYGKFEKIVSVPESGNLDTIQAKLENGVLVITIEKVTLKKQTRTIQIQ